MSLTVNYSWDIPDVGADENTWGDLVRTLWTDLDTLLGGTDATEFALLNGANTGSTVATLTGTETLTSKTLTAPTVGLPATMTGATNDWAFAVDGDDFVIQYNGVDVLKVTTAGAIIAKDDVTAFGTP